MAIDLTMPWPDPGLSPNTRSHWRALARAKTAYRRACWATALSQLQPAARQFAAGGRLDLWLEFCPPDARRYDRDNLIARMKAGIDGIADALQIDDQVFEWVAGRLGQKVADGEVRVRITESK